MINGLTDGLPVEKWVALSSEERNKLQEFEKHVTDGYRRTVPRPSTEITSFTNFKDWTEKDYIYDTVCSTSGNHRNNIQKWADYIHRFVRENGKPAHYPIIPSCTIDFQAVSEEVSIPVFFPAWSFDFASSWDTVTAGNFWMENGRRFMKPTLQKPGDYAPKYTARYDPEFSKLNDQISEMKGELSQKERKVGQADRRKEVDNLKEKAKLRLFERLFGGVFASAFEAFISIAILGIPYLVCYFLIVQYGDNFPLLQNLPIWVICAPIVLLALFRIWKHDCFEIRKHRKARSLYVKKAKELQELDKTLEPVRREVDALKREIQKIQSSAEYKEAERRNKELYDADCKLAKEWQQEWYYEVLAAKPDWILIKK